MDALFDYTGLAKNAGVSPEQLAELESHIRRDYGSDEMMVELRMLRTLRAVRDGVVSVAAAIAEFGGSSTPRRPKRSVRAEDRLKCDAPLDIRYHSSRYSKPSETPLM